MASTSKSIVSELNKEEKLNGNNYKMWHRKVQLILEEQEALETLTNTMVEPRLVALPNTGEIWKHIRPGRGRTIWLTLRCRAV
ncbi:hypothetical protein LWI28_007387 [Acer negundo]|uniref:DUF4219 domain-containing protein n=1 Tax=Acer negundo TaxID=4023 RepID=A0AAD5JJ38_ACENE|nr:hypothetical protein LWI28_007387 [Acer negundo]